MHQKTLRTFYLLEFCFNLAFSFFFATYSLFLLSRGLNYLEMNLVNVVCMISGALLEIPTGSLADNYGRKRIVVIAYFTTAISFLVYFFGTNLPIFIVAEIIAALGGALYSGAFEAWAIDELRLHKPEFSQLKVLARRNQLKSFSWIVGPILGGLAGGCNLALPWLMSSLGMAVTGFLAIAMVKETAFTPSTDPKERVGIKNIIKDSVRYGIKNKAIFFLSLSAAIFSFTAMPFNMFWQPVSVDVYGLPVKAMGAVFVALTLAMILGNHLSTKLSRLIPSPKKALLFTLTIFGLAGIAAGQTFLVPLSALGLVFNEVTRGLYTPYAEDYLHARIPSRQRATIQSFVRMLHRLAGGLGMLLSGYIATKTNPQTAWLAVSLITLIAAFAISPINNGE